MMPFHKIYQPLQPKVCPLDNIASSHVVSTMVNPAIGVCLASWHMALLWGMLFIANLICPANLWAQDRLEFGILAGGSYYLGEMNPSQQFKDTRAAFGVMGRYIFSDRVAAKAVVSVNGIKGAYNSSNGDVYSSTELTPPSGQLSEDETVALRPGNCSFKNQLLDISVMGEINFLSFDHAFRKDQTRFTPYITLGLGCTSFRHYDDGDKKRQFCLSLPFGIGCKYKVNKLLRLGLEWTFHKTFTDKLECIESLDGTFDPSDPYKNGKHTFTHNNDWFSALTFTLSFSMWPRSLVCNDGLRTFRRD